MDDAEMLQHCAKALLNYHLKSANPNTRKRVV